MQSKTFNENLLYTQQVFSINNNEEYKKNNVLFRLSIKDWLTIKELTVLLKETRTHYSVIRWHTQGWANVGLQL